MKLIYFLIITISTTTSSLLNAQVLWHGDPDQSLTSVFRRFDENASTSCTSADIKTGNAITVNDETYGKVWKIFKPINQQRAELARTGSISNPFVAQNGQTYYYGWRWKINASPNVNEEVTVWQLKTDVAGTDIPNTQNYPLNMEYDGNVLSFNAFGPGSPDWTEGSSIKKRRTIMWEESINENEWMTFVIKIKLGDGLPNAQDGYVEFWYNGVEQELKNKSVPGFTREYSVNLANENKRAYHKTFDGKEVYVKWGAYNSASCSFATNTYYDEMRVGQNLNDVLTPLQDDTSIDISGDYYLRNIKTGRYLQVYGTNVQTNIANNGTSKTWSLVATSDGYYNIDSKVSNRGVLDTNGGGQVVSSTIEPSDSQANHADRVWLPERVSGNVYRFKNKFSYRDYLAEVIDNNTIQYTTWDGDRAQWELISISNAQ